MINKSLSLSLRDDRDILIKVPAITALFWITKVLTTGMGEVFSDFLVKQMNPMIAVLLGGAGLAAAMVLQFSVKRYIAWIYWLVVVMVSIFGTMAADVVHVVIGIPYLVSTAFFAIVLAGVFIVWFAAEKTLSIHSIDTFRRETFYWMTVLGTFALGTASGDMTATTLHLGYFASGILFAVLLVMPAVAYWKFGLNPIFSFWFAYVMTRPVGASFSDWLSKPLGEGGIGWGEGQVSLVMAIIIVALVGYLQITKMDAHHSQAAGHVHAR
ncbi:hypothetical protein [Sporolactobacillus shoreae]|uniref:COG4705 family protein n=1 Tax=Sporolactobacillus shoreae TaxID=1465501 RepID=UPI001F4FB56B|nr:hypothetical protein [Sporolactobacillus shoreae]